MSCPRDRWRGQRWHHRRRHHHRREPYALHKMLFVVLGVTAFVGMGVVGLLLRTDFVAEHKYIAFFVAAMFIWGASGAIAHKLVRPVSEIARVAREIGGGDLSSRVHLGRSRSGEIGDLADAINDMAGRIEKQMADQRALLAAVSHEIRTPLGHMRVIAELARSGDLSKLAELEREIDEVDTLVDQLLASSRLEFDTMAHIELDAVDVCVRALERADVDAAVLDVATDDTTVHGDPALLARAVGNLLENAVRYADGVDALRIDGDSEYVRFTVSDRGPGFANGDVDTVFEQFHRGQKNAKATHGSLGLGLSLVRRIAAAHGGRAWAENTDRGARVMVEVSRG